MKKLKLLVVFSAIFATSVMANSWCYDHGITKTQAEAANDPNYAAPGQYLTITDWFTIPDYGFEILGSYTEFPNGVLYFIWPTTPTPNELFLPLDQPWADAAYLALKDAYYASRQVKVAFCFMPDPYGNNANKRIIDRVLFRKN